MGCQALHRNNFRPEHEVFWQLADMARQRTLASPLRENSTCVEQSMTTVTVPCNLTWNPLVAVAKTSREDRSGLATASRVIPQTRPQQPGRQHGGADVDALPRCHDCLLPEHSCSHVRGRRGIYARYLSDDQRPHPGAVAAVTFGNRKARKRTLTTGKRVAR
jgi:hypothetical protein